MYTMGRDREKAMLASNPSYKRDLPTHFAIVDAYHDWHEGTCTPTACLDRVFQALGANPGKFALETAGYWFGRAAPKETAFIDYVRRLAAHKSALARSYAVWEMPEPEKFELIEALANDRSRRVRAAVLNCAMMGRWLSVIPILRQAQKLRQDDPRELERALSLISQGYHQEEDGSISHYCGEGPGGAGGLGGTEASRAEEALEILARLAGEELEHRRIHGRWPSRPKREHDLLSCLRDWSPLTT